MLRRWGVIDRKRLKKSEHLGVALNLPNQPSQGTLPTDRAQNAIVPILKKGEPATGVNPFGMGKAVTTFLQFDLFQRSTITVETTKNQASSLLKHQSMSTVQTCCQTSLLPRTQHARCHFTHLIVQSLSNGCRRANTYIKEGSDTMPEVCQVW